MQADGRDSDAPALSVVVPTWNGLSLLQENLPSIQLALSRFESTLGHPWEFIVVDDGSTDGSADWITREVDNVFLVRRSRNGGFAKACNSGFDKCRGRVVALLNNDLQIEADYFLHLFPHFDGEAVFAVTAKVYEWDPPVFATGGRIGRFRRGFWSMYFNYDAWGSAAERWNDERPLLSAYAIGGFACYDRAKLQALGGFNELLSPFHWEDVDLSYRGWKRGWEIRYEPRSHARHHISATIDSHYKKGFVEMTSTRNRLLFHWINLHSPSYLMRHILMLVLLLGSRFFVLDFGFYRAFLGALQRLRQALACRKIEKQASRRTDVEVQELLQEFYETAPIRIFRNHEQVIQEHAEAAKLASR